MKVKTSELPGIGKSYALETAEGARLVVIVHHQGNREFYYFEDPDQDDPSQTFLLTDEEARQVGTILLGVDYQPVTDDRMEFLMKNLRVDWLKVAPESCLAGKSILESQIRKRTGATVIAIQRREKMIGSPDVNEVIQPGDILMSIGTRDQTKTLESLCQC
ncbi:TrkA-C domain protein [uncultured Desulfatiglans sp.]|nr:TrkA-C domain protein [uncultured Desulfatiglans sp.]